MRRVVGYGKSRYWLTLLVAAALPSVTAAGVEYVMTRGVSGEIPIAAAVVGGIVTMFALKFIETPEDNERPEVAEIPEKPLNKSSVGHTSLSDDVARHEPIQSVPKITEVPNPSGQLIEERFFSPRTLDELVAEVKGLTNIVAEDVSKRHIGHWLRVEGCVKDVWKRGASVSLLVGPLDTEVLLHMEFDGSLWRERLVAFNVGDQVSAIGKIESIGFYLRGSVRLEKCELVYNQTPNSH